MGDRKECREKRQVDEKVEELKPSILISSHIREMGIANSMQQLISVIKEALSQGAEPGIVLFYCQLSRAEQLYARALFLQALRWISFSLM